MRTPEITFQALLAGWDQLPDRVGDDWWGLLPDIQRLIDAIATNEDEEERALLTDELLDLFRPYQRAWRNLSSGMRAAEQQRAAVYRGSLGTDLTPTGPDLYTLATELFARMPFEAASVGFELTGDDGAEISVPTVTRYTDISCPRRVWVQTPRFSVIVRLTVEVPELSAAVLDMELSPEAPVQVQISAPGFELLSAPLQATPVLPDADSPPLVFDLRPTQTGGSSISFDFFQLGQPLGTVSVPIETTAYEVVEGAEPRRNQVLEGPGDAAPPDIVLHIAYEPNPPALRFTLLRDGGASWQTFPPKALNGDPAAHAAEFYRRITALARSDDPTADLANRTFGDAETESRDSRGILATEDIDRRLRQLGQNLWRELIPKDLQDIYGQDRDQWRDRTLLVLSDEPHIPWELLWPYGQGWSDDGPWCETLCLTRWLRCDDQGNGNAKPPVQLHLSPVALIAPTDSGLPAAQAESAMLTSLFGQRGFADASPAEPTWSQVMDMLEAGNYQWVHVAAHGSFYPEAPDADSALWLQGRTALNPDAIVGPEIETHLAQQRPVFIFNCCEVGRQGWSLTRIGGWANRLIGAGAGLYIGPHWIVSDGPAKDFALSLYENLLDGDPVGEAVRKARLVARQQGDPTWLAYSVYAHPNARVVAG